MVCHRGMLERPIVAKDSFGPMYSAVTNRPGLILSLDRQKERR